MQRASPLWKQLFSFFCCVFEYGRTVCSLSTLLVRIYPSLACSHSRRCPRSAIRQHKPSTALHCTAATPTKPWHKRLQPKSGETSSVCLKTCNCASHGPPGAAGCWMFLVWEHLIQFTKTERAEQMYPIPLKWFYKMNLIPRERFEWFFSPPQNKNNTPNWELTLSLTVTDRIHKQLLGGHGPQPSWCHIYWWKKNTLKEFMVLPIKTYYLQTILLSKFIQKYKGNSYWEWQPLSISPKGEILSQGAHTESQHHEECHGIFNRCLFYNVFNLNIQKDARECANVGRWETIPIRQKPLQWNPNVAFPKSRAARRQVKSIPSRVKSCTDTHVNYGHSERRNTREQR